jgi:hypothetical protein
VKKEKRIINALLLKKSVSNGYVVGLDVSRRVPPPGNHCQRELAMRKKEEVGGFGGCTYTLSSCWYRKTIVG